MKYNSLSGCLGDTVISHFCDISAINAVDILCALSSEDSQSKESFVLKVHRRFRLQIDENMSHSVRAQHRSLANMMRVFFQVGIPLLKKTIGKIEIK